MEDKLEFGEFIDKMFFARKNGEVRSGVIVFSEKNWDEVYPLESRSYVINNLSNYFDVNKISKALWGTTIDKTDKDVRLDYYLSDWEVDYCYFI